MTAPEKSDAAKAKAAKAKQAKIDEAAAAKERKAKQDNARKEAESAAKGAETSLMAEVAPIAKEVNVRLGKANKNDSDATDHRLSAALQLGEAEAVFKERKVKGTSFKAWVEQNIVDLTYESVRKLIPIAKADDPVAALEDYRADNARRNRKSRLANKPATAAAGTTTTRAIPAAPTGSKDGAYEVAQNAVAQITDTGQVEFARGLAKQHGFVVVDEDAAALVKLAKTKPLDAYKKVFRTLDVKTKLEAVTWAAGEIGQTLSSEFAAPAAVDKDDDLAIPAALDQRPAKAA